MDWASLFTYEPDTGRLLWAVKRPGGRSKAIGEEAGSVCGDKRYRSVFTLGKRHYVHRVIWEMVNGPVPQGMCIDHIDGNGLNNRIENLRVTTLSGNQRNRRVSRNNRTGVSGVFHAKNGFAVTCGGQYVGYFQNLDAAVAARKSAEPQHGYHPNNGRRANARDS